MTDGKVYVAAVKSSMILDMKNFGEGQAALLATGAVRVTSDGAVADSGPNAGTRVLPEPDVVSALRAVPKLTQYVMAVIHGR
jgi:hypothetical protein